MSDTIFADDPSATETVAPATAPASDPYNDLLKGIVNDDGVARYATVSDALNAIPHKDSHISTIEGENATYRTKIQELEEALSKAGNVDSLLEKLDARQEVSDPPAAGITEQDILRVIGDSDKEKERNNNAAAVVSTLRKTYGDKAEEVFYAKAGELGIDNSLLDDLAKASPNAALELFKVPKQDVVKMRGGGNDSLDNDPPASPRNIEGVNTHKGMLDVWRSHIPSQE